MGALEVFEIGPCALPMWGFRGKFGMEIISFVLIRGCLYVSIKW
jgi:hypothetical protein